MLDTINEYRQKTGKMIGVKPAGGIATPDDALHYYLMVKETLGNEWLDKKWFRIGASRLVGNLLERMK
jgi:deoxyribose-phosphate aldolase